MKTSVFVRVGYTLKLVLRNVARISEYQTAAWTKGTEQHKGFSFDWNLSVSVLNLEDKPLYFCSETVPSRFSSIHSIEDGIQAKFPQGTSFALTAHDPGDQVQSSVRNSLAHAALERDLISCKPSNVSVTTGFTFSPGTRGTFRKCFFLTSPRHQTGNTEQVVTEMARKYGQPAFYRYVWKAETIVQELVATVSNQLVASFPIVSVAPAPCPPSFADASYNSVFHGMKKTKEVLLELQALQPGVFSQDFWSLASSILDEVNTVPVKTDHPVVVIEGLDGTGKSTLCENLSKAIPNSTLLATPPKDLLQFRTAFDGYPPLIRRAYYSLGNYIAAKEMRAAAKTGPVIVDRYWHSSAAYAIASDVECGGKDSLPPQGHEVYHWPPDLLKPHVAILLVVSPETRVKRMNVRGGVQTKEEVWLERSHKFQERLLGAYERMELPSLQKMDANGTREEVLGAVYKVIQGKLGASL